VLGRRLENISFNEHLNSLLGIPHNVVLLSCLRTVSENIFEIIDLSKKIIGILNIAVKPFST
jgi:hypothetical protein